MVFSSSLLKRDEHFEVASVLMCERRKADKAICVSGATRAKNYCLVK